MKKYSFLLNGKGVEKRYIALMVCFSDMLFEFSSKNQWFIFIVVFFFRSLGRSVQQMLLPCSTLAQIFCKPLAALEVSFQLIFYFTSPFSVMINKYPFVVQVVTLLLLPYWMTYHSLWIHRWQIILKSLYQIQVIKEFLVISDKSSLD